MRLLALLVVVGCSTVPTERRQESIPSAGSSAGGDEASSAGSGGDDRSDGSSLAGAGVGGVAGVAGSEEGGAGGAPAVVGTGGSQLGGSGGGTSVSCAAYSKCNPSDECIVSDWIYKGRDCDARFYSCGEQYGYETTTGRIWSYDAYVLCEISFICYTWPKGLEPSPELTVDSCRNGRGSGGTGN